MDADISSDNLYDHGRDLMDGKGVEQDPAQAAHFFSLATMKGHKEALTQLEMLAKAGNAEAQYELGLCNLAGKCCVSVTPPRPNLVYSEQDEDDDEDEDDIWDDIEELEQKEEVTPHRVEAAEWFILAAKQGHAEAIVRLGDLAKDGVGEAEYGLGLCYKNGWGVEQDDKLAVEWLCRADHYVRHDVKEELVSIAEAGNAKAQYLIGLNYDHDSFSGAPYSWGSKSKVEWMVSAAQQGHPEAVAEIKEFVRDPRSKVCDPANEAYRPFVVYWQQIAQTGAADAQYYLGLCYHNGISSISDENQALQLFMQAAQKGCQDVVPMLESYVGSAHEYFLGDLIYKKDAFYLIGLCYESGWGCERDASMASKYFGLAMQGGHVGASSKLTSFSTAGVAEAQYQLSLGYLNDKGVAKNLALGMDLLRRAVDQGHPEALYQLGLCYEEGKGVDQDETEASKWFAAATRLGSSPAFDRLEVLGNGGNAEALYQLGLYFADCASKDDLAAFHRKKYEPFPDYYYDFLPDLVPKKVDIEDFRVSLVSQYLYEASQNGHEEALAKFLTFAEAGHKEAQYEVALCYENGQGCRRDMAQAFKWFMRAAAQGHADADCHLANCYAKGYGVEKDIGQAVKLWQKAADNDIIEARYQLGLCHLNGNGVAKDMARGIELLRMAADKGHPGANYQLGLCYEEGKGVDRDLGMAAYRVHKAAESHHAKAEYWLGLYYKNGVGNEQDKREAIKWFLAAILNGDCEALVELESLANEGDAEAQCQVGFCYENGKCAEMSMERAVYWYTKAAEQGHAEAQYQLGQCYLSGHGVPKDKSLAKQWFRKAAIQSYLSAELALTRVDDKEVPF